MIPNVSINLKKDCILIKLNEHATQEELIIELKRKLILPIL